MFGKAKLIYLYDKNKLVAFKFISDDGTKLVKAENFYDDLFSALYNKSINLSVEKMDINTEMSRLSRDFSLLKNLKGE